MRHALEGNQSLPLVRRLPARPITALPHAAHRDATGRLVADVPIRVGEDNAEGRHVPRPQRLAELRRRAARSIASSAVSQPPAEAPSHFSDTGPVPRAAGGSTSSTIGPLRE